MTGLSRAQKRTVFLIADVILVNASFVVMMNAGDGFDTLQSGMIFLAISGIAVFASIGLGMPRIKLNAYGRHAIVLTGKFAILVTFSVVVACQLAKIPIAPTEIAQFCSMLFLGSITSRYCMLAILLWITRQGQSRRKLIIYGAGDTGHQMALALRNHPRIVAVAFLDDNIDMQAMIVAGLPVLSAARIETVMRDFAADLVVLAMPSSSTSKLAQITRKLQALGLQVQSVPSFAQLVGTEGASVPVPDAPGQYLGRAAISANSPDAALAYEGRVVLVSGAGGSVGSELCRQLLAHRPKRLVLFELSELALFTIDRELRDMTQYQDVDIVTVLGSVTDTKIAYRTMIDTQTEVVFHAAAYKHVPLIEANPVAGLANNVIGTRAFAEAATAANVARFVLISTDKAVRPTGVMGATKRLAELVVHDLASRFPQTHFSTVRFGNVMGSSGSVVPLFHDQIARGGPVTLTHEKVTRYFMTLSEAAQLVLFTGAISQNMRGADVFVLDMGPPMKIRDLAERMIKAQGLTVKNSANPSGDIEILVTGLRPGEKLYEEQFMEVPLLPTQHPKVLRAQSTGISEFAIASALKAARAAIDACDQLAARAAIAAAVEGFPSPPALRVAQFSSAEQVLA